MSNSAEVITVKEQVYFTNQANAYKCGPISKQGTPRWIFHAPHFVTPRLADL